MVMNQARVIAEWRRARMSLRAASACLHCRCYADAVSRAYYAVFHAARASLQFHANIHAQTHRAVQILFGQHLVKTNVIEPQWISEIGSLYDQRREADYEVDAEFSEVSAREVYQRAARFLERILRLLAAALSHAELA